MLKILLTARLGSNRLPAKHLVPLRGKTPAITCLIERLQKSSVPTVLCIPSGPEEDALRNIARAAGIEWFDGDPDNVLVRYEQAMRAFSASAAIIVDGDDAFVSVEAIDAIAEAYDAHDVVQCAGLPYGGAPYLLSQEFVQRMLAQDRSPNGWSRFLREMSGKKLTVDSLAMDELQQGYRLSLDYEEDLEFMRYLYKHLSREETMSLVTVVDYITKHLNEMKQLFPAIFDGTVDEMARRHINTL